MKRAGLLLAVALAACRDDPAHCDAGEICAFAGTGVAGFGGDEGGALEADFYLPMDVVFGPDRGAYVIDWNNHRIRRIGDDGVVRTVAGSGELGDETSVALESTFNHPTSAVFDAQGRLVIAAWHNSRIKRLDLGTMALENICGTGLRAYGGDGGPAALADLDLPTAVAIGPGGELFVLDQANQLIRRIDAAGNIQRVAGRCVAGACHPGETPAPCGSGGKLACLELNPTACETPCLGAFEGDGGDAKEARLSMPVGQAADPGGRLAFDAQGNLYFADTKNHRIRRITPGGIVTTVAGVGSAGYSGDDAPAVEARLNKPIDLALGPDGDVYFTDTGNSCVRAFTPGGTIRRVAGRCTVRGNEGDGGSALEATLDHPYGLAFDSRQQLYVADTQNNRLRRVAIAWGD